ncbi:MAG: RNA polymerase factor sigma-54 [Sphingomonadaceae bacterium]
MALAPRLDLRQTQTLVMTPQLQQAIRLLALSNLELEGFIAGEIEKNPLLATEGEGETAIDGAEESAGEAGEEHDAAEHMADGDGGEALDLDPDGDFQDGAADLLGVGEAPVRAAPGEAPDIGGIALPGVTLHEHLLAQAGEALSGPELVIAAQLIERVEETGYLAAGTGEIARRLNVPPARVERVLGVVQSFDPTGVGARSLAECLALQAREADRYDPAMARLIDNLGLLAAGDFRALKRICGVDEEDLADMIRELRAYDPKPGCRFESAGPAAAIVPDVFVAARGGGWAVELNAATLPRLIVDRAYHAELGGAGDDESRAWLDDCLTSANWLVRALDQRAKTILKVARQIVRAQEGFFREGVARLKPLTLREIAAEIEMHESTVSRVTSNKYLHCARGLFELKYFFSSGVAAGDGEAASARAVKAEIKALIEAEDAGAILSDEALASRLKAKGYDIARRTVAKYREAMGIGSSAARRRRKKIDAKAG